MQDKLQELTEKLYNEGLSKGREEGERILGNARSEAEEIIRKAKEEAAGIVAAARKDASDLTAKVNSDLKMASSQCLQATKKDIENILSNAKVSETLSDTGFLKKVILAVAEKFSADQASDLEVILPESMKGELEGWASSELAKSLNSGITASFSKKVAGGFTIAPKDGGWYISLTDETFNALIGEYLRPVTRKLLFG